MNTTSPVERRPPEARISYAQNQEDILLDRLFQGRRGTFVDIGANHPFLDSNTYYFYIRGWRGVNVEPSGRGHALLEQHRPADRNLRLAVSDADSEATFHEVSDGSQLTGLSTLSQAVANEYREQGFQVVEQTVPIRTVASLIDEFGIEPPDIMSIDVESHEGAVLEGIPLDRWRPAVFVIEATEPLSEVPSWERWEPRLLEHGYRFACFNGVNRFYLREDLSGELHHFATPVNALDHCFRQEVVALQNELDGYRHRYEHEKAAREFERQQFAELKAAWTWGAAQARHAQAVWEQECASFASQRGAWEEALEYFKRVEARAERERQQFAAESARWEEEKARWHSEQEERDIRLHAAHARLRPYRLVDPLRLVERGYGLSRRLKRWLVRRS